MGTDGPLQHPDPRPHPRRSRAGGRNRTGARRLGRRPHLPGSRRSPWSVSRWRSGAGRVRRSSTTRAGVSKELRFGALPRGLALPEALDFGRRGRDRAPGGGRGHGVATAKGRLEFLRSDPRAAGRAPSASACARRSASYRVAGTPASARWRRRRRGARVGGVSSGATGRLQFLDGARGLALVFMVLNHTDAGGSRSRWDGRATTWST